MAIEKIIDIKVQGNADVAVGTLKQQLKAAKSEVIALSDEFGITSTQAIRAAEKAAELSHEIANANKLVKSFNPSTTLNSTTQALGSVKEGFEVAGSTMKTFGLESVQLEGALGKVGVAMELTSGITAIQESGESFKRLGATLKSYSIIQKIITAGQYLWNAAIMANPIGAIIIAITALIAAGVALTKYFISSAEASEKNSEAIKENSKALKNEIKAANDSSKALEQNNAHKLAMAKASGQSAEAIRKLELKLIDEQIAYANSSREIAKNTYEKNKNILASLKANDADEEQIKSQEDLTKNSLDNFGKQTQYLRDSVDKKKEIQLRHQVEIRQTETDHNQKLRDKAKEAAEKAREDLKEQKKKDLEDLKSALKAQKDATQNSINEVSQEISNAQDKQNEFLGTAQQAEEQKVKDKYFNLIELAKQQGRSKDEIQVLEFARENELNDIRLTAQQKQYDDESKIAQAKLDQKKAIKAAEEDLLMSGLSTLKNIFGKNKEIQKGVLLAENGIALAKLTMSTIEAVGKDNAASPLTFGMPWSGIHIGQGVLGATNIIASTAKGLAALGGGSAGSAPSMGTAGGGGGAPTAPQFNIVGNTGVNQLAQTLGQEQAPIKTYVTAGDVTTGQSLNRNIITNASLG